MKDMSLIYIISLTFISHSSFAINFILFFLLFFQGKNTSQLQFFQELVTRLDSKLHGFQVLFPPLAHNIYYMLAILGLDEFVN